MFYRLRPPPGPGFFASRVGDAPLRVIEGESWDAMAHSTLALAASGTVTVEAALLGVPMVTFYKVTTPSWLLGKLMVKVPYYTMVNLIAGRRVVPELMQGQMTGSRIAGEALRLLRDAGERERMLAGLAEVRRLTEAGPGEAPRRAAAIIQVSWKDRWLMYREFRALSGALPASVFLAVAIWPVAAQERRAGPPPSTSGLHDRRRYQPQHADAHGQGGGALRTARWQPAPPPSS